MFRVLVIMINKSLGSKYNSQHIKAVNHDIKENFIAH
jgi:hypothetical protein